MMRHSCPNSPVWPRFQRERFRRRRVARRLVRWLVAVAEQSFSVNPSFAEGLFWQASRVAEAVQ